MNVKRTLKSIELSLKKAAPDICMYTGLVLSGVAVFEFCKKTVEAQPVIEEFKSDIALVQEARKDEAVAPFARDKAIDATKKACVGLTKAYWKPALLWTASNGLIIQSHVMLKNRNVALTALATGLGAELRTLHSRIIERYGEDVDRELKHGIKYETIEETHVDEASGSEVVEQKQIPVVRLADGSTEGYSIYARFFDEASRCWRDDADYNLRYLRQIEANCNRILREEGVLFLNQVYDMLDIPKTKIGQKVGWRYFKNEEENIYGDNFVSFGIYNIHRPSNRDFVNGYEKSIILDFNVDGNVIDALPMR